MANNKRRRQARKKSTPKTTTQLPPTNKSSSQPSTLYTQLHITTSTLFDHAMNTTSTIIIRPTIAMFTDIYELLGAMTVTVLAILYPVVTRTFSLSESDETPETGGGKRANKSKRPKNKKNIRPPILPTRTAPNTPTSRTPSPPNPALPPRQPASLPASSSSADPQRESVSGTPPPLANCSSGSDTAVEDLPDAQNRTEPANSELTPTQELEATLRSKLPGDARLTRAIDRLATCLEKDLRIAWGRHRLVAFLQLVHDLHFGTYSHQKLPLDDYSELDRYLLARDLAYVFLKRYGTSFWPVAEEPAPHLLDRSLQCPRDVKIPRERYTEWQALMQEPPKRGSMADIVMSKLGYRMTKFIEMVYCLPLETRAHMDMTAVEFVLDDASVWSGDLGDRLRVLPQALRVTLLDDEADANGARAAVVNDGGVIEGMMDLDCEYGTCI